MTRDLARMKRRFIAYIAAILAVGTAVNGLIYQRVEHQARENCAQLEELVDFTKGSYQDLITRIRVIPPAERTAAAGAQLATLESRLEVLNHINCKGD